MKKIKPNLMGILLIVFGVIVIVLGVLFFAVDPNRNEMPKRENITNIY